MANDAVPVKASTSIIERGAPTPKSAPRAAAARPKPLPDLPEQVLQLNKHLQSSGRPNHYRLDTSAGRNVIQEINPDTSEVIAEIPANEFKALAQVLGFPGLLFDAHA